MAGQVWTRLCNTAPPAENGPPGDCAWTAVPASIYQDDGYTKEQYDQLFGALTQLIVIILAVWLIKKAIEM